MNRVLRITEEPLDLDVARMVYLRRMYGDDVKITNRNTCIKHVYADPVGTVSMLARGLGKVAALEITSGEGIQVAEAMAVLLAHREKLGISAIIRAVMRRDRYGVSIFSHYEELTKLLHFHDERSARILVHTFRWEASVLRRPSPST